MKKIFTLSLALAVSSLGFAESVKVLSCGMGTPGLQEPQLIGLGISPNGKYVCGAIENGAGIFIADTENDEVLFTVATGSEGGELRHIDNNGLGVGIYENGITYSFDTETVTELPVPEGFRGSLCESITNDGSMIVGSLAGESFDTKAAYFKDGEWTILPTPTEEEICGLNVRYNTSAAKQVSGDGKVIFGFLGSFTLPIVWTLNDAGEYEYDFFPARFLKISDEYIDDETRPLYGLSAQYLGVSNNGRYLSMVGVINIENFDSFMVPVIYDLETRELIVYSEPQDIDDMRLGLYPTAICDDGTFIGTVGMPYFASAGSFIWEADKESPELFRNAFPAYAAKLGEADELGFDVPDGLSADGRYIVGYTFYSDDYYDQISPAYNITYVIDREGVTGVENISAEAKAEGDAVIYDINGVRHNNLTKGVNIVRMSDGSVRKVLKK